MHELDLHHKAIAVADLGAAGGWMMQQFGGNE